MRWKSLHIPGYGKSWRSHCPGAAWNTGQLPCYRGHYGMPYQGYHGSGSGWRDTWRYAGLCRPIRIWGWRYHTMRTCKSPYGLQGSLRERHHEDGCYWSWETKRSWDSPSQRLLRTWDHASCHWKGRFGTCACNWSSGFGGECLWPDLYHQRYAEGRDIWRGAQTANCLQTEAGKDLFWQHRRSGGGPDWQRYQRRWHGPQHNRTVCCSLY